MDKKALIKAAVQAQQGAIAPYSHFHVGAALLTQSGKIITGCNIESAAFSPTCCAERTALVKALSDGERSFAAIAIVGGVRGASSNTPTSPCGVCRQMLYEYCGGQMPVLMAYGDGKLLESTLGELLPLGFGRENMS